MSTVPDPSAAPATHSEAAGTSAEWWRTAVIYQVYPRSFADADGDGLGDLPGITTRMPAVVELGVDAIWLSPFYPSPQNDAGYDVADYCDVDARFGTLADFDALVAEAHRLGLKLIVDLVPNHTSSEHPWFQAALSADEGSPERARYLFRDGCGPGGDEPPNNWRSVFGGPGWSRILRQDGTPGQWFLHLFDATQPDLDWSNSEVLEEFRRVLRFWLDRGVDGFRVDVAHGLIKQAGLPDEVRADASNAVSISKDWKTPSPAWAQDGVHEIYRDWHSLLAEYPGDRVMVAEAWVDPLATLAKWVRPDEMSQAFNFVFLQATWDAASLRTVIGDSLEAFTAVGAPSTWVLSNHDVIRHATRLMLDGSVMNAGVGPLTPDLPDRAAGLRRARAATALMLALPGSAYLYQGEELGLPEDTEVPDAARQDPTWFRTHGERYGRDGCRVPIPWEADAPAYGFNESGASWLPQPDIWSDYARDRESTADDSTLTLYRRMLALRSSHRLGASTLEWLDGYADQVVAFRTGDVTVVANTGPDHVELPDCDILLASGTLFDRILPADTTVWLG